MMIDIDREIRLWIRIVIGIGQKKRFDRVRLGRRSCEVIGKRLPHQRAKGFTLPLRNITGTPVDIRGKEDLRAMHDVGRLHQHATGANRQHGNPPAGAKCTLKAPPR